MPLKSFTELYKLDVKKYIHKKPTFYKKDGKYVVTDKSKWLDYIEWATIVFLLYDNGAEAVEFGFHSDQNQYPAFYNVQGKNPFVRVWVKIDDKMYEMDYPVIDGNKEENNPSQMTIHKAQQRAFVKCVAINTGLGLSLWQKEEGQFHSRNGHIDEEFKKFIKYTLEEVVKDREHAAALFKLAPNAGKHPDVLPEFKRANEKFPVAY